MQHINVTKYPSNWRNLLKQHYYKLQRIELNIQDPDYIYVQNRFKETMPLAKIKSIVKIQNSFHFRSYQTGVEQVQHKHSTKNPEVITQMSLWHGTRFTNPELIINGEEGFDMKYSNTGMWGRGLYFA